MVSLHPFVWNYMNSHDVAACNSAFGNVCFKFYYD